MTFKPPYWYHDNVEFSYDDLKELKFDIDFIGSEKYAKENQHISTYFLKENLRPDKKYNDLYSTIVRNIVENVGVYDKVKYDCTYWTQLYEKGMKHRPHHHAHEDKKMGSDISWVHFLDVPKQKCFRFTDTKGNILIPNEQNSGDIICFPSWVWHEVIPNQTSIRRVVISGNITFTHYDD